MCLAKNLDVRGIELQHFEEPSRANMKFGCLLLSLLALRVAAAEPADLTRARDAYQKASERALTPVKAAYWNELTRLIDQYTKAGKLDEAIAVKNELAKLTGGAVAPLPTTAAVINTPGIAQLRERFVGRTFVTPGGTHFTFNKDGTGTQRWSEGTDTFNWEVLDEKTVNAKLPSKQYFFWFESRFKGEIADALDATRRSIKVKE
jgi:hypothetical protein